MTKEGKPSKSDLLQMRIESLENCARMDRKFYNAVILELIAALSDPLLSDTGFCVGESR